MCHNWFVPMTVTRFWMYHLMSVAAITIFFSAYKRKKYKDILEATAILELKNELEQSFPNHYLKPNFVHTVMTGGCTDVAYTAVQNAYSFKKYDTPPRLFLWYYLHIWLMLFIDIGFTQRQRQIYSFAHWMPESFKCSEFPCENLQTTCYVSRSTEKSILLSLHLGIVTLGMEARAFSVKTFRYRFLRDRNLLNWVEAGSTGLVQTTRGLDNRSSTEG